MKTPSFLYKAPVEMPNRSGFDMSFPNVLSGRCGTLYPVLNKFLIPGTTIQLDTLFDFELPPMVSNFRGQVDMVFRAYFVPASLCWGGFEHFATHPTDNPVYPVGTPVSQKPLNIPHIVFSGHEEFNSSIEALVDRNSLANYLGVKVPYANVEGSSQGFDEFSVSALPFLAYHRIYHDHVRNNVVQAPCFGPPSSTIYLPASTTPAAGYAPFGTLVNGSISVDSGLDNVFDFSCLSTLADSNSRLSPLMLDGVSLLDFRQSNFALDYFTAATPRPQAGGAVTIDFEVDTATGDASIPVSLLRQQNAFQKWRERNNYAGYDYGDQVKMHYGVYPDTQKCKKAVYLGEYVEPIYSKSVYQQAQAQNESANPFADRGGVGAKFGSFRSNGSQRLVSNFTATCHGFLMVLCHMRPVAEYDSGIAPQMFMRHIGDVPFPLLSTVGDQLITNRELIGVDVFAGVDTTEPFGFIDRYADYKTSLGEVHGEMVTGGALELFSLKRSFDDTVQISSEFLEIPQDYLEVVKSISSSLVPVDFYGEIYFRLKVLSPLPKFSVPTLGDLKYTHTKYVSKRGTGLA